MYIFKKKCALFRIINSKIFDLIVYSFTFAKIKYFIYERAYLKRYYKRR